MNTKISADGHKKAKSISIKKRRKSGGKSSNNGLTDSYNHYKFYDGQQYTGMKIGRRHSWYYDKGEWKERKITPDNWEISYNVVKRRKGKAPEGSGVPVGTEYHWYILADQYVKKLNANDYTTEMTGYKLKIAHKRANKDKWNISETAQRKRLIKMLKEFIKQLEKEPVKVKELPPAKEKAAKKRKVKKVAA